MQRILAATDFSTRSHRALRRAGLLANQSGAELTLLHVVDDDQPEHLIALEQMEGRKILEEQIASVAEIRGIECRPLIVTGAAHDAILRTAKATQTDLIVMGSHRKNLLEDVFVGTTIERVIRRGTWPVLKVNTETQQNYETVLVAVDLSDASAEAVRSAQALGFLERAVSVVYAFHAMAKSMLGRTSTSQDRIQDYVENERIRAVSELQTFMNSLSLAPNTWASHVREGEAMPVISNIVEAIQPQLLVVGTHGRSGISKILLGSVAEQLLRELDIDILAVPRGAAPGA